MSTMSNLQFPRQFKMIEYRVSHGLLLLRSQKTSESQGRIDILFTDVRYIDLPTTIPQLFVEERPLDSSEVSYEPGLKRYSVSWNSGGGQIVAGSVSWCKDEHEYAAPSSLMPERTSS